MIKHALAVALLGIGVGFAAAPASAGEDYSRYDVKRCFELPVVGAAVAFVELLRDDEFGRHCDDHRDAEYVPHESYKDGAVVRPEHRERLK